MVLDLDLIFQFSRQNCIAICAFLVPANLVATIQTFFLVGLQRPIWQIRFSATTGILLASTLFLHIATWFIIGVVTPVSFILAVLGATCITVNIGLLAYHQIVNQYLKSWKETIADWALLTNVR